jgi:hypothetical protein
VTEMPAPAAWLICGAFVEPLDAEAWMLWLLDSGKGRASSATPTGDIVRSLDGENGVSCVMVNEEQSRVGRRV